MLIRIGQSGERRVSVTKPERKKLTDALEILGLIEEMKIAPTDVARDEIRKVLAAVEKAVAESDKKNPLPGQQTLPGVEENPADTSDGNPEIE